MPERIPQQPGPDTLAAAQRQLPVKTLVEALPELQRPFTANALHWKVQASQPKWDPVKSLIVPYIDARLVIARLNAVVADLWEPGKRPEVIDGFLVPEIPPYTYLPSGALRMALTVCGVTRYDVGEAGYFSHDKSLQSDALKRTAVHFGIGTSLYAIPKVVFELPIDNTTPQEGPASNEGDFIRREKGRRFDKKKNQYVDTWEMKLKDEGILELGRLYEEWLESDANTFGPALNHGDAAGAIGDPEDRIEELADQEQEAAVPLSPQAAAGQQALTGNLKGEKK